MSYQDKVLEKQAAQAGQINTIILDQEQQFIAVSTDEKITWQKECGFAMQLFEGNAKLKESALSNPESLRNAIINVSAIGVSLNPMLKHAYLVPRRTNGVMKICLDISYQGLLDLAVAAGAILWGQAKMVYADDEFTNNGVGKRPTHIYKSFGDRGQKAGVYCVVKTMDGDYLTEEMDIADCYKIQALSPTSLAWKNWFDEMCRKAVIKRAAKFWPGVTDRISHAVQMLHEDEGMDLGERDITPESESESLRGLLSNNTECTMHNGMSIENWVLASDTKEEYEHAQTLIKGMPEGNEKVRLVQLWRASVEETREALEAREAS